MNGNEMNVERKIKYYHMAAGILLILTGLITADVYLLEDLYHFMKYEGMYRYAYNIERSSLYIKTLLFLACGTFYLLKRKKLLMIPSVLLFVYFMRYANSWFAMAKIADQFFITLMPLDRYCLSYFSTGLMVASEALACLGLSLLSVRFFSKWHPGILMSIFEGISLIFMIVSIFKQYYIISTISSIAYTLYKIPLLAAMILIALDRSCDSQ